MDTRNSNNFFSSSSSSSSSLDHLPWLWVIETLSNFKQVDTALLYDLISRVSELTDESWAETAKEILALKQLEDLFSEKTSSSSGSGNELASSNVSRFEFNVSDRAQDVLRRLLQMMEMPNMRKLLLKFLQWDVSQFVYKKRASLPKYDLHQLKNAILEGVDPAARSLREISGLDKQECEQIEKIHVDGGDGPNAEVLGGFGSDKQDQQETRIPINGGSPNADAGQLDHSVADVEIQSPQENSYRAGPENGNQLLGKDSRDDDLNSTRKESPEKHNQVKCLDNCRTGRDSISNAAGDFGQSLKDGEGYEINWDSDTLAPENEVEIVQEKYLDCCLIPKKRQRSDFSEVEVGLNSDTDALCMKIDDHIPGVTDFEKNGKLNSMGQSSAPLHRNELVQDSSGRGLSSGRKEDNELAKGKQVQNLQGNENSFDHGDGYNYLFLKRPKQGIDYGEIVHNQSQSPSNAGEIPQQAAHLDRHHQNSFLDEAQMDSDPKEGRSGGNNEIFDKPPSLDSDDEMAIVAEKRSFLSSQNTFNPDSETSSECVEQSFCVKCYKGGKLLACSTSSCPVAIHESCLDPASFSGSGVFYCPFCSYLQAIVAYSETKKKAALTKKREALAKNRLAEFLCTVNAQKQTQSSERTLMKEQVESQMAGDNHLSNENRGSWLHQQEAEVATDRINNVPSPSGAPTSPAIGRNDIRETRNDHREQVSSHKSKRVVEEEKCAEPCAIHRSDSLSQSNEITSLNYENTRTVLPYQNRDNREMDEEHQSVLTEERKKGKSQSKSRASSCGDVEAALVHDKHAEVQQENEDSRLAIVPYRENYCKLNFISNESPEKQNDVGLFVNVRRQLRFPTQYSNRIAPSSKREIIDWTAEEVEMLKEGVHNFTKEGEPCPWKTILEFGRHVFDKSRTRVDLKNKWNNICKKEGRRKR